MMRRVTVCEGEELDTLDQVKHESVKLAERCRLRRKQLEDVKKDTKVTDS